MVSPYEYIYIYIYKNVNKYIQENKIYTFHIILNKFIYKYIFKCHKCHKKIFIYKSY